MSSVKCEEKKVKEAYHVACLDCSIKLEICAKCLERFEQNELLEEDSVIPLNFECSLKERDKRSFLRQKEKITSEEELKELVEKFQKKTSLDGLDEDDFDDFTDDEEKDQEIHERDLHKTFPFVPQWISLFSFLVHSLQWVAIQP
ncbi:hypothetical protein O9G_000726 [Rozella allomycis CSF55]|uniref:Uncharacterized protein n=1 Tax=Rozella allomycis (strain CSF55) TaxID=988480 RepID=A0A075AYC5_ROZAC|nr:hypothetical protein O9G_000726 [Rozella allomycis CSF55]|eukprot:EPZ35330.1 hypothetical protein O9G_000726 [Rozella allomycis CSF55]